jgi:site-specific DNA recombinase
VAVHRCAAPRIVGQDLFERASAIKQDRGGSILAKPESRNAFSLLKCGCCGACMSVKDTRKGRQRIQCTQMKECGTCEHRRVYDLGTIERTVFDGLKVNLTTPDLIAAYVETYNHEERKRLAAGPIANRSRIEKRLARAKREFDRIFQSRDAHRAEGRAEAFRSRSCQRGEAARDRCASPNRSCPVSSAG